VIELRTFTEADRQEMEARHRCAYRAVAGGRTLVPVTHAGNGRIAHVSIAPSSLGALVNWRVLDAVTGDVVVYSCERGYGSRSSDVRAVRRALRAVHLCGCTARVRVRGVA
jgi:hypothetical protein